VAGFLLPIANDPDARIPIATVIRAGPRGFLVG
jgi:hypothetical protein